MKMIFLLPAVVLCCALSYGATQPVGRPGPSVYTVKRLTRPMKIDANWNKPPWRSTRSLKVNNFIRGVPAYRPVVEAKMLYDDENVFVIFRVRDKYVRSITTEINGPVWKDAAVEFFFSPDTSLPENYFNLEVNCGGTALLGYRTSGKKPVDDDVKMIEIAHSLPKTVDPEITDPVTWTVEYRIPFAMLKKYSKVTQPKKGIAWRANFYKIAENNSNPHHITWAVVGGSRPTFHSPKYFGTVLFQ